MHVCQHTHGTHTRDNSHGKKSEVNWLCNEIVISFPSFSTSFQGNSACGQHLLPESYAGIRDRSSLWGNIACQKLFYWVLLNWHVSPFPHAEYWACLWLSFINVYHNFICMALYLLGPIGQSHSNVWNLDGMKGGYWLQNTIKLPNKV